MSNTTQIEKVYHYLATGKTPTKGELRTRLKIKNPTAVISNLRAFLDGKDAIVDVYSNKRTNHRGQPVTRYALGMCRGYRDRLAPFGVTSTGA